MRIELLTSPESLQDMTDIAVCAGLTCRGRAGKEVIPQVYLGSIIEAGHESVLEHINVSYSVTDLSRAVLQELARHRHVSLSVKSTRHTIWKEFFNANDEARDELCEAIGDSIAMALGSIPGDSVDEDDLGEIISDIMPAFNAYLDALYKMGKDMDFITPSQAGDFLKYFLPECFPTDLILTLNIRELRHILKLRTSDAALFEFQAFAYGLYDVLPDDFKWLVEDCVDEGVAERVHNSKTVSAAMYEYYEETGTEDGEED